jgi:hypothetical protein
VLFPFIHGDFHVHDIKEDGESDHDSERMVPQGREDHEEHNEQAPNRDGIEFHKGVGVLILKDTAFYDIPYEEE